MKFRFLILIGFLFLQSSLLAQPKYPPIEELVFDGYYNWGFIWVKAGRVHFSESKSEKYPKSIRLNAVGYTLPSWDWMFRLRDTLTSHFDENTFLPYESRRCAHEGSYHKTFDYLWDYKQGVVFANIHRIGKYKRRDTVALKPPTYDMLSVAWMARELDFDKYRKNDLIPMNILIDKKIYNLYVRYLGVEKVKIDRAKHEAYVFSPLLVEGEVFKGGENMKIWVSKDNYRLPLMVEAKILVGSVKGILNFEESRVMKR